MEKILVTTQLTFDDFKKLSFHLMYRHFVIKFLTGFGIFFTVLVILLYFLNGMEDFNTSGLILGLVFTFMLPIITYRSAKTNYSSNQRVSENMTYEFDDSEISIEGESFNTTLTWDKVFKVSESKDFILIWQSRQTANAIPRRDFSNDKFVKFRQIVSGIDGIKNKLKK